MKTAFSRLRADDSGSIVFGWLGRLTLTLTVLGLICFEVLSIVVTRVGLEDVGQTAGDRALTVYSETNNPTTAYLAADQYASSQGASLVKKSFTVSEEAVSFDLKMSPRHRGDTSTVGGRTTPSHGSFGSHVRGPL